MSKNYKDFPKEKFKSSFKKAPSEAKREPETPDFLPPSNLEIYKSLFYNHPDAVFSFNLEGNFISVNESALILGETTEDEILNSNFLPLIPIEDQPMVLEHFAAASQGKQQNYKINFISFRGTHRILNITNFPIRSNGNITGVFGIARDITESENQKKIIKEGQQRLKNIMEQSLDIICTMDEDGKFREVSSASLKIIGYSPEELKGNSFINYVFSEDLEETRKITESIKEGKEITNFSNRYLCKDGSIIPLIWSSKWVKEERLFYSVAKDGSEIKIAQQALIRERSMLKAIVDNIPDYIFALDQDHRTVLTNKKFYSEYLGMDSEQKTLSLLPIDYLPGQEGDKVMEDNQRIMDTGIPVINRKDVVIDHTGKKDVILLTKVPFKSTGEEVSGLIGVARNITEIHNFEKEQELIYRLVKSLSKSTGVKTAFSTTIKIISNFFNFEAAEAWKVGYDNSTLIKIADFSNKNHPKGNKENPTTFLHGIDLPRKTFDSREVEIISFPRSGINSIGISAELDLAVGVPIISKDEVVAVLTFFRKRGIQVEYNFALLLKRVAIQIATDVRRKITENQLNNMFKYSPNLIAVIGLDGYLKKVNPAFNKIFGYKEDDLLNTPFSTYLHPEEKAFTFERLREVAEGRSPRTMQIRCLAKNGEWKWISWTPSELIEEEGIVHLFGIDITPLKTANLELLKYKNIIESSKDGIGLYSLESKEFYLNSSFKDILGVDENDVAKITSFEDLYGEQNLSSKILSQLMAGKFWNGDIKLKNKEGELADFHFSGGPIFNENNELIALFGLHRDIRDRKAYESSLKTYGKRINNILESITDGFFSLDLDWKVTYWNKEAENLLKISRKDVLNKNFWNFFPRDKKLIFYSKFNEVIESGEKISFEDYFEPLNIWVDVSIYPNKEGLSIYFRNITERKTNEEQLKIAKERYDLVAMATMEAVYDYDVENNSLQWNEVFYHLYGYETKEIKENLQQWEEILHPEDRLRVTESLRKTLDSTSTKWEIEYRIIKTNKKISSVLERGFIIRDALGRAIRMIGALQDITELKQNEIALEELNYKLQKHANELLLSNAELEQFAYIASHDLQEPLRMVTSFLTLLQKKYDQQLDEKAQQYIFFATDGAVRMRQIILDLLEYSRVGKLKYDLEKIDLNSLLQDVIHLNENLIRESGAIVKFQNLPQLKAAVTPLQRVFSNLISNSIKYIDPGTQPFIEIDAEEKEKHWQINFTDNGIGINQQFYEKIFIIFQRLHPKEKYSGTGIGLAICKKIVESHGGKIWVTSGEEKGSTFHFTINKQI